MDVRERGVDDRPPQNHVRAFSCARLVGVRHGVVPYRERRSSGPHAEATFSDLVASVKSLIWAGSGLNAAIGGSPFGVTVGALALDAPSDLVGNRIQGEPPPGLDPTGVGVRVSAPGVVARNRIYGGSNSVGTAIGIWVQTDGARIENNMIHSGSGDYPHCRYLDSGFQRPDPTQHDLERPQ